MNDDEQKAQTIVGWEWAVPRGDPPLTVILEPQGMPYTVEPGHVVEVRFVPPQDPVTVQERADGAVSVWCEGWGAVFIDDVEQDDYLPTRAGVEYFRSPEYAEELRGRQQRLDSAVEVLDRYRDEHEAEFLRLMQAMMEAVKRGDYDNPELRAAALAVDPEVLNAMKVMGPVPPLFYDLTDGPKN